MAADKAATRAVAASADCSRILAEMRSLFDTDRLCTLPQLDAKLKAGLAEVQTEWRNALNDARVSCGERCRAMGKTIVEDSRRNTVVQAVAEARTEACTVACNVLKEELDAWYKEREIGCSQAELVQLTERLAIVEEHLEKTVLPTAIAKDAKNPSSVNVALGSEDAANIRVLSEACVHVDSQFSATPAEVKHTHTAMHLEQAIERHSQSHAARAMQLEHFMADTQRLSAVDIHGMQTNVQGFSKPHEPRPRLPCRSVSDGCVRVDSQLSETPAEAKHTHSAVQLEHANVRADIRAPFVVDIHGMQTNAQGFSMPPEPRPTLLRRSGHLHLQTNMQKLPMQSDACRRDLEHVEKHSNKAWH